ncbi:MAG: RNA polymerase sigma factor RpoD/SigA, partial [Fibrobacteria bacterium]
MVDQNEQLYFRDLYRHAIITPDEEKNLVQKIKAGDSKSMHRLILGNLRFVVSIARRYQGKGLSL